MENNQNWYAAHPPQAARHPPQPRPLSRQIQSCILRFSLVAVVATMLFFVIGVFAPNTVMLTSTKSLISQNSLIISAVFGAIFALALTPTISKGWQKLPTFLLTWFVYFAMLMVLTLVLAKDVEEAWIFHTRSTTVTQEIFRIQRVDKSSGRGGTVYRAYVNPAKIGHIEPSVFLAKSAYDYILTRRFTVAEHDPGDISRAINYSTNLCISVIVEHAGYPKRIILDRIKEFTTSDLLPCPQNAV